MKRTTIVRKHIISLVLAIIAGLLMFMVLYETTAYLLDRHFDRSGYYESHEKAYVASLKEYLQQNGVSVEDTAALTEWGKQQDDIFFQIYSSNELIFQYYSRESKSFQEAASLNFLELADPYPMQFADGIYQVIIFGGYYYKPFNYTMIINVSGAFLAFLAVFLPGIRRRTRYIMKLRDEIEILGSGNLDYEVSVKGNDELTDLADNLDQMRIALKHHMAEENRLTEERQIIVTKLSHDIRTPLTSMNLFADLLKRGAYEDEAQREHYLDRIQENAANLANMAEELFQVAKEREPIVHIADKEDVSEVIPLLADAAEALRLAGFTVQEYYTTADYSAQVGRQDFIRVLNNITSNIMRYADPSVVVSFACEKQEDKVVATFENGVSPAEEIDSKGSGIGLWNIQELIQKQGGSVVIESDEKHFRIQLFLPQYA